MRAKLEPAAEAFDEARRLVRSQVRVVDARAQAWAERPADRDALHDTRTALRRLRVFVRSFRNELGALARRAVRRRLRKAFRACSSLRDLDVFAAWVVTLPRSAATRHLLSASATARKASRDAQKEMRASWNGARRRLRSERISAPTGRLRRRRFGSAAARAVRVEVRAVEAGLAHFDPVRAADAAHETRIAAKRLRYLIEALSGRPSDSSHAVEWCRGFQDLAGDWRDATLASARVRACPQLSGKKTVVARAAARRRRSLQDLRRFAENRGAWQVARREALALARRYRSGSRTSRS